MEDMISRVLIIAGSDSGGGAGLQADLKTVSALDCYGMTAVTALTAQNTTGVHGVVEMTRDFVAQQIDVCIQDMGFDSAKTGMLSSAPLISLVAAKVREHQIRPLVVDPVMISKSGARLLKGDAIEDLKMKLLPLATVTTPNIHEASAMAGFEIRTIEDMKGAARAIHRFGPKNVVVKGGHLPGVEVDLLYDGRKFTEFRGERIDTVHTNGTGCIFASAIAAGLAQKKSVQDSVATAKDFISRAIRNGFTLGKGCGPANPMAWILGPKLTR